MNKESETQIRNTIELMNELKTKFNDTIKVETPRCVEYKIYSIMEKLTRIILVCEDFINRDEEIAVWTPQNIDEFNSFIDEMFGQITSDTHELQKELKN